MGNVTVGKDNIINLHPQYQSRQICLVQDGNSIGIKLTTELRWISSAFDVGDLRRSEGYYLTVRIVTVDYVEIMKITPGGPHDEDSCSVHIYSGLS